MTYISPDEREELSLAKAAQYLLDESRMVLPGIQALFGFQLIAVFNPSFSEKLTNGEQRMHLLAIALIVVAIALVMSPAAYHRQVNPREVTEAFIRISTWMLLWSMWPLAVSICLEAYLVGRLIFHGSSLVAVLPAILFGLFFGLWFALPRLRKSGLSRPGRV
jgi:hypothetical protein